jgi:hypothetical protein
LLPSLSRVTTKDISNAGKSSIQEDRRINKRKREQEDCSDYGNENEEEEEEESGSDDASAEGVGSRRIATVETTSGSQIRREKIFRRAIEYDPNTHERKIPIGPLGRESKYEFLRRALVRY